MNFDYTSLFFLISGLIFLVFIHYEIIFNGSELERAYLYAKKNQPDLDKNEYIKKLKRNFLIILFLIDISFISLIYSKI